MQTNPQKLLLAAIRNGDYAHPGEEQAIEIAMQLILGFDFTSFLVKTGICWPESWPKTFWISLDILEHMLP